MGDGLHKVEGGGAYENQKGAVPERGGGFILTPGSY